MFQAYALKFEDEFRCLNHGDFHCNNIMFQYDDEGKIKETKFIDLQMSRYCSPAQDLIYILLSSVSIELKISKFDYFIGFYHRQLIENLKLLRYPKTLPTLRSIHVAIINHIDWGNIAHLNCLGKCFADHNFTFSISSYITATASDAS